MNPGFPSELNLKMKVSPTQKVEEERKFLFVVFFGIKSISLNSFPVTNQVFILREKLPKLDCLDPFLSEQFFATKKR